MNIFLKITVFFTLFFSISFQSRANRIEKGFEALNEYNYFEAKKIFFQTIKKDSSAAGYGLATLFFRNDNPFHSLDSAYKYVCISVATFHLVKNKEKLELLKYGFEYLNIIHLRANISLEYYHKALKINTIEGFDEFILKNDWSNERFSAIYKRDSLAFENVRSVKTSKVVTEFTEKYPSSEFHLDALKLLELCVYQEMTVSGTIESYIAFCTEQHRNRYEKDAEDKIYELSILSKSLAEYSNFISLFPMNRNVEIAWKKVYQLYMVDYTEDRIQQFQTTYPDYPFIAELEQDIKYAQRQIIPYKFNGMFGFMDYEGNSVIEPNYEYLGFFNDGLAVAVKNGKYGYIDKGNTVVVDFIYDSATDFENSRAIVGVNERLGVINRAGFVVLPIEFNDIGSFSEGLIYGQRDSLFGYYDNTGNQRIDERYFEAFSFMNGIAKVQIGKNQTFIDVYGVPIVAPIFESIHFFNDSLLVYEMGSKFGICRINGSILDSAKYGVIGVLSNGRAVVTYQGKLGYMNGEGKIVLDTKYDEFPNFLEDGQFNGTYAIVRMKGKFGVIDHNGKFIISPTYYHLGKFSSLMAFSKGKGWGFIDLLNTVLIPAQFEYAESFNDGYALVDKMALLGLINPSGKVTVPFCFNEIQRLDKDRVIVTEGNDHGVYTVKGEEIVPTEYQQIRTLNKDFLILTKASEVHYLYLPENKIIKPKLENE